MKPKKIFNTTIFCLFVIFLAIYGASKTGYYEYENKKQKELTEEEIKRFEEDVAKGKNVNINDYLKDDTKYYDNRITNVADKVSNTFYNGITRSLEESFKLIEKIIGE